MNESQERREELLRMSRQKWGKGSIPAVHPRFFRRKWRKQFLCADVYQFPNLWDVCGGRLYRGEDLEIYALADRVTD